MADSFCSNLKSQESSYFYMWVIYPDSTCTMEILTYLWAMLTIALNRSLQYQIKKPVGYIIRSIIKIIINIVI